MPHESEIIARVHGYLRDSPVFADKIQLMNNNGFPDVIYRYRWKTLFVEYKKIPQLPARNSTKIRPALSPLQYVWLTSHYDQGGHCWVVVYSVKEHVFIVYDRPDDWKDGAIRDALYSIEGYRTFADHLREHVMSL